MTTPQQSLGSPFTASSTAADVIEGIDLTGKTVIVTGGYAGLGLEATKAFASAGAHVIVPARDAAKAGRNLAGTEGVAIESLDLMDPASIDGFAERFLAAHPRLDVLVNNAGVMAAPLSRDARGNESQFSTNVLGHFRLTARLWPALVAAGNARVVVLSSANHRVDVAALLRDPNFERTEYDPWKAYANSKAANALFAVALDSIGKSRGVRAFAVHPGGIVETDLARHMDMKIAEQAGLIDKDGKVVLDPEAGWKNVRMGAATEVWAATSPLLEGKGGVYLSDNDVDTVLPADAPTNAQKGVSPQVIDPVNAGRLFQLCLHLTGVRFD